MVTFATWHLAHTNDEETPAMPDELTHPKRRGHDVLRGADLDTPIVEDEAAGHTDAGQDEGNVAPGRAQEQPADVIPVSPHGEAAEAVDPWVAGRWAPHGDLSVADEGTPEGEANAAARDQARGLNGDSLAAVKRARRAAGPASS